MKICRNISLRSSNTFGLNYKADTFIVIKTEKEARFIFSGEISIKQPVLVTGSGSNILFIQDFEGTIINSVKGNLLLAILIISLKAAPSTAVTIPILKANSGIGFLYC